MESTDVTPDDTGDLTPGTGEGTGTPDTPPDEPKTFTQEQVNAIAAKEASKAARGKLDPKDLGFDSAKEAQEFLEAARQRADADKDEATKEFEAATKEAYERGKGESLALAKEIALNANFKVAAIQAGVIDPEGAFALAKTLESWDEVEVNDDGSVTGLDDAYFESFRTAKPYLFAVSDDGGEGPAPTPRINPGASNAPSADDDEKNLRQRYPALQQSGVTPHQF